MKVSILTSPTAHHLFYVNEMAKIVNIGSIVLETSSISAPFETSHQFEAIRASYEHDIWDINALLPYDHVAQTLEVENINEQQVITFIDNAAADLIIVFGTRRIKKQLIQATSKRLINLHGGNPEEYRGLDSHLWSIYHNDFDNLQTCIHSVNEKLDDGAIIDIQKIPLHSGMKLHELRRYNTEVCVKLSKTAINQVKEHGNLILNSQHKHGRYYSFMPSVLKDICINKFERHTKSL